MILGVRMHTGWAAVVAVSGSLDDLQIHCRCRIDLMPSGSSIPRFVYHAASEMQPAEAPQFIKSAVAEARMQSRGEFKKLAGTLPAKPDACGILTGSTKVPDDLDRILASHPLIHSAEGKLFCEAVSAAAGDCGIPVVTEPEKRIWTTLAAELGRSPDDVRAVLDAARARHGAPWGQDQKLATAAALLARARVTLHAR